MQTTPKTLSLLTFVLLFTISCPAFADKIIYVDADATGADDGLSWADGYKYLQDGLSDARIAEKPVEIRVAGGNYRIYRPDKNKLHPDGTGDRHTAFQLINGVTLKGGYAGLREPDPNARDSELYYTILSGDLNGDDGVFYFTNTNENSYHVVTGSRTDTTAILDGVLVAAGNADGQYADTTDRGGGMYNGPNSSPRVINCKFIANYAERGGGMYNDNSVPTVINSEFIENRGKGRGGGMYNYEGGSDHATTLIDCVFKSNYASNGGGGIYNDCGAPVIENCTFAGNSAPEGGAMFNFMYFYDGIVTVTGCKFVGNSATGGVPSWGEAGAMYNYCGNQTLINCLFSENTAADSGSALYNVWCTTTMINCTLSGQESDAASGMFIDEAHTHATNCIFWDVDGGIADYDGFETITYCNVQGGWPGEGNMAVDPCFVQPGYWDPGEIEGSSDDFWVDGDYHLKSQAGRYEPNTQTWVFDDATSQCIDAGNPMSPIGLEPFPNGGIINMGAYGATPEASKSYFGEPVCDIIVAGDINGDCKVDFQDVHFLCFNWMEDNNP